MDMSPTLTHPDAEIEWLDRLFFEHEEAEQEKSTAVEPCGTKERERAGAFDASSFGQTRVIKPRVAPSLCQAFVHTGVAAIAFAVVFVIGNSFHREIAEVLAGLLALIGLSGYAQEGATFVILLVACASGWLVGLKKTLQEVRVAFYLSLTSVSLSPTQLVVEAATPRFLERVVPRHAIVSTVVRQRPIQKLYHCGDVIVLLSDRTRVYLHNIERPDDIARLLSVR